VGAVTGAEYEVFHHRPLAREAGLPEETIERVVSGARTLGDKSLDALVTFVDQVIDSARNEAPSTEAIGEYYSDQEVAEIVLLVGHYLMTALFIKTLGIQPEDTAHLQAGVAHALLHAPKGGSHGT
jgi:alkylhydroperoxidase family enzyme